MFCCRWGHSSVVLSPHFTWNEPVSKIPSFKPTRQRGSLPMQSAAVNCHRFKSLPGPLTKCVHLCSIYLAVHSLGGRGWFASKKNSNVVSAGLWISEGFVIREPARSSPSQAATVVNKMKWWAKHSGRRCHSLSVMSSITLTAAPNDCRKAIRRSSAQLRSSRWYEVLWVLPAEGKIKMWASVKNQKNTALQMRRPRRINHISCVVTCGFILARSALSDNWTTVIHKNSNTSPEWTKSWADLTKQPSRQN